jgi:hypothetical protein
MVQHIKREHPGLDVICGNVVTTWQVGAAACSMFPKCNCFVAWE